MSKFKIGDKVVIIGDPECIIHTVTKCIVWLTKHNVFDTFILSGDENYSYVGGDLMSPEVRIEELHDDLNSIMEEIKLIEENLEKSFKPKNMIDMIDKVVLGD